MNSAIRIFVAALAGAAAAAGANYHIDCAGGSDTNDGASPSSPWKSAARANGRTFLPGDSILLKRGTRCAGTLWPKGSGEDGRPITLGAYGEGPLPVIDGGSAEAAVKLFNQQYWHIEKLEITGGSPYGLYIGGDRGALRHFRVTSVVAHDVAGTVRNKETGLIMVVSGGPEQTFHDVVIDGVTAYNTTQWAGILVHGDDFGNRMDSPRSAGVTVRNSIVHDVYGDGILLAQVNKGLMERNVAWNTGMQETLTIGTPSAIWEWMCDGCAVRWNESFRSDTPGVDGGGYDIDCGNTNNTVENNFAHDEQGYCVAVFGCGSTTASSVVCNNLCINNGRSPRLARRQGDVFLSTWEKGSLDGVDISNNTILWNPATDAPALVAQADYTGNRPNLFRDNVIATRVPNPLGKSTALRMEGNTIVDPGRGRIPSGAGAKGLATARRALKQAAAAPLFEAADPRGRKYRLGDFRGKWLLLAFLEPEAEVSRGQLVFLKSMREQYGRRGLEVAVVARGGNLLNAAYDWNLGEIPLLADAGSRITNAYSVNSGPVTFLIAPDGRLRERWEGLASAPQLWLALHPLLGAPQGTPPVEWLPE